jgi:transcriptional regulator with AAA-type ATPase domain
MVQANLLRVLCYLEVEGAGSHVLANYFIRDSFATLLVITDNLLKHTN